MYPSSGIVLNLQIKKSLYVLTTSQPWPAYKRQRGSTNGVNRASDTSVILPDIVANYCGMRVWKPQERAFNKAVRSEAGNERREYE